MANTLTGVSPGLRLHGELHSTDASADPIIALYRQDNGNQRIMGTAEQLHVTGAHLVTSAGGDAYIYADLAGIKEPIVAVSTGSNYVEIAGDATHILAVGDTFYVNGSTGNDGLLTITAIAYDATTNRTRLTVASITDSNVDGYVSWVYYAISAADASGNTFTLSGDRRAVFPVGRKFIVNGSTGNDNSGNTYTVTATSYSASANTSTISVSSVADGTDDGYIIPQPTALAGKIIKRGTYAADGGVAQSIEALSMLLEAGFGVYGHAPSGAVDFNVDAWRKLNITQPGAAGDYQDAAS